jgi:hypothetical protein
VPGHPLATVGWTHAVATVIEDAARQQSHLTCLDRMVAIALRGELLLDGLRQVPIEDGRMLARADLALELDLSDVEPVAQEVGERASCQGDAANRPSIGKGANLGDDSTCSKIGQKEPDASEFEVAPEDGADGPCGRFSFPIP